MEVRQPGEGRGDVRDGKGLMDKEIRVLQTLCLPEI